MVFLASSAIIEIALIKAYVTSAAERPDIPSCLKMEVTFGVLVTLRRECMGWFMFAFGHDKHGLRLIVLLRLLRVAEEDSSQDLLQFSLAMALVIEVAAGEED
ncbi:hypothetical protein RRG08_010704 [Elysia crispata]|uniref:Uncharacterized protein n=1 Tax=Elysia crispata TaxID=231223 RepID=A0AAE1ED48_9GAST|nr:hypothetical protein RRG08_010704 [Elysia crispata]